MGLLTKILSDEKTPTSPVATQPQPDAPPADPATPCIFCGGTIRWLSVYLDGIFRCAACDPPPSESLVRTYTIDGESLQNFSRRRRQEAIGRDSDNCESDYWRSPNPFDEKINERYELTTVDGWPTMILKNEFREVLKPKNRAAEKSRR